MFCIICTPKIAEVIIAFGHENVHVLLQKPTLTVAHVRAPLGVGDDPDFVEDLLRILKTTGAVEHYQKNAL